MKIAHISCVFQLFSIKFAVFTGFKMTSIRIKQNPIIFVRHFSFLSDKNFQTVGQLSSNYSDVYAKTEIHRKYVQFSSIGD